MATTPEIDTIRIKRVAQKIMQAQVNTSTSIQEVFIKSSLSQKITLTDWQKLNLALSEGCLTQEEQRLIRRVLHSVRRGWFDLLGEESAVSC